MDKFVIEGGRRLSGKLSVSGAKNGSLALMPASLLAPGFYHLYNTPDLNDIWTMLKLISSMGVKCDFGDNTLTIDSREITSFEAPYEHVKKMRASFYVLGPLIARFGKARVSLPGGCAWGPRPVDLHLRGLEKLGAEINIEGGYVNAQAKGLTGAHFHFDISSVGATGNVLMAATLAKGTTLLTNAAIEPEITALEEMLVKMGAKINGVGTTTLEIEGVEELNPVDETTIPDRIEAATYLIAAAMTKGEIIIEDINPSHLSAVFSKLEESGCELKINNDSVSLKMDVEPKPVDLITSVYPGIPTDIQAQWTAYMLLADGVSKVTDTIYHDRFMHIPELQRLGADINVIDNAAIIQGGKKLTGAVVMSSDLRASASLILVALVAEGQSEILRIYHIDRGYDSIEDKLNAIGASVKRVKTDLI
ncbi:MAG: UDP-N-acetylglucosamine 1-carboxyvinyltransferase [Bacteroidetes bacterium]|nr:MAG: UDP-N-acetylglucosamine 1-carboxyvinyltransferase [Bacteroidota bacterium]